MLSLLALKSENPVANRSKKGNRPAPTETLRIIGGRWRGRLLPFVASAGLRPTGNRIRETLFNWLQLDIPGSHCLDLFAGAGALGFEALSRGAAHCSFVEASGAVCQQLKLNADKLEADNADVTTADALRYLQTRPIRPFDIVFLDPPFHADLWQDVIDRLGAADWLSAEASVYIESPPAKQLVVPAHWHLHRQKQAGQVMYRLFRTQTDTPASR